MGVYLNNMTPFSLYSDEVGSPYFVDKTMLLAEIFPLIRSTAKYICITRPRRFGKTVMANMLGAFLGRGSDSGELFCSLKIAGQKGYRENLNSHNVIWIDFSEVPRNCRTYGQYINRIENQLLKDLTTAYPDADIDPEGAVWDALKQVFAKYHSERFSLFWMNGMRFFICLS